MSGGTDWNSGGICSSGNVVADGVPGDCVGGTLPRVIQVVLKIVVNRAMCCLCGKLYTREVFNAVAAGQVPFQSG